MKTLPWHFPVDATPDTRELERSEIKTQVHLATGRLGLGRAAQEHSFPRMLYQVGPLQPLSTQQQAQGSLG